MATDPKAAGPSDPLALAAISVPERLAAADRHVRWTFAELDAASGRIVAGLRQAGVGAGDRVGLLVGESVATAATIHAVRRLGGVLVPLNRRAAPSELAVQAGGLCPAVLAHDNDTRNLARALARSLHEPPGLFAIDELLRSKPGSLDQPDDSFQLGAAAQPFDDGVATAALIFTSGSTGQPKAALLTRRAQAASAEAWADFLLPEATDRWLVCLPFHHVAGLAIVDRAARWRVPAFIEPGFDPAAIVALVESDAISHLSVVGSTLGRLLDAWARRSVPPTLRAILVGGEPADPTLVRQAALAGLPVVPTYGLTETGSGVTALAAREAPEHPGSVGRPLRGVEIRIRNSGRLAAAGQAGDIEVRGSMLFAGYVSGRLDRVEKRVTDDGWFRTGDLGAIDSDGRLTIVDRRDDLIIAGGENISPAEVESLLRSHPAIVDAAVIGRPDDRRGVVPVAAIVVRPDAQPTDAELTAYCRAELSGFKVPVVFLRLDAIPRTSSGKLIRAAVRDLIEPAGARP